MNNNMDSKEHLQELSAEESQKILEKYDRESAFRTFTDYRGVIISVVLICFSLFQLYSTWHVISSTHMRPIHLAVVVTMAFILYPAGRTLAKDKLPWYDFVLALAALGAYLYPVITFNARINQFGYTDIQIVIGVIGILLLLEACRRVVGLPIVIIASAFVCIGLFGAYLPGFIGNCGFNVAQIVQHLYYTQEGVFGTPIGASSTFIFLFILFGSFLEKTGVGAFFIDMANAICGNRRGGPAKVAVITSALMGTVSGSSVANTVGSGSFTIPMMKKLGYKPEFAGAVEAASSTGGQLMPPVMGAAAFLMAENLGLSFAIIIKAAILPALLYFAGIYIVVDIEAKKLGLTGMPKDELPKFAKVMLERGFLILPLIVIIVLLSVGYSASLAALIGIIVAIIGSYFPFLIGSIRNISAKENKQAISEVYRNSGALNVKDFFAALENGARSVLSVALACGVAGIIVGMITKTGIGLKMGAGLSSLAGDSLFLLLIFTMIASIILGMGVPTTPNYLITSTIMAPIVFTALMSFLPETYMGLSAVSTSLALLPAHMFAFYFGIVADITPPVALAAMAGSAIAKGDPLRTGVNASKLAIAAFLIPYIFVMNPALLMINCTALATVQAVLSSMVGLFGIGMGLERFFDMKLNIIQEILAVGGGLMLVYPGTLTDVAGLACVALVIIWQKLQKRRNLKAVAA